MQKTVKSQPKKEIKTDLKTDVYNVKGEKVGKITLPEVIFGAHVKPALIAQAVRVYMVNKRQGTRKTQTRGQTTGSTRKIYRQKHTGRARHGDIKAPIFVGGGVAHGPKVTDFHLDLSKKMRRQALYGALTEKFQMQKIKFIKEVDSILPKTKNMVNFLENLKVFEKNKKNQKSALLITENVNGSLVLAGRNIPALAITPVAQLNTYDVLKHQNLLFVKSAVDYFESKKSPLQDEKKEIKKAALSEVKKSKTVRSSKK